MSCRGLSVALCAALALAGCDSNDSKSAAAVAEFGPSSTYLRTFSGSDFVAVDTFDVRTVAEDQAVGGERGLTEVAIHSRSLDRTTHVWYRSDKSALVEVAYRCPTGAMVPTVVPESPATWASGNLLMPIALQRSGPFSGGAADVMARRADGPSCPDTPTVREDPRVVFRFPLRVGAAWRQFSRPWQSDRKVVGREEVTVPAGRFDATVIETQTERSDSDTATFEWTDYVAEGRGLVLRVVRSEQDLILEDGTPTGERFTSVERVELLE